jgi:hypothetical protein
MEKTIAQSIDATGNGNALAYGAAKETVSNKSKKIKNPFQKLIAFSDRQQKNWIGWTAATMAGQMCVLTPITLAVVVANGDRFGFWIPAIISCFATEVSNLAHMPMKVTIPVFCASLLVNISIILLSFIR